MSDTIHGITFIDYAATNAFLAQGKDIAELLPILAVELPQWEEAAAHWENEMKNDAEFKLVTQLGEVFSNPAQGKYASSETRTTADATEAIPDLATYIDIQCLMSVATNYGVDPQAALAERGVTVMDFSQAGLKYQADASEAMRADTEAGEDARNEYERLHTESTAKYEAYFREHAGGALGDGVEF